MFHPVSLDVSATETGIEAMPTMPRSAKANVRIEALAETIFDYLDDHRKLGAHMSQSSWMMLGSTMNYEFDAAQARSGASRFGLHGRIMRIPMSVEQVVAIRTPPGLKVWETIGAPNLWVIGHYRMGFEISPQGKGHTASSLYRLCATRSSACPLMRGGALVGCRKTRPSTSRRPVCARPRQTNQCNKPLAPSGKIADFW
jgi:hypothetical protein